MPEHPEPTTNIGKLLGKVLEYEQIIQRVIDDLDSVKTLSVGGTSKQPVIKGIHAHGNTYDWDMGILKRTA